MSTTKSTPPILLDGFESIIAISGTDAGAFLQGQTTNDASALTTGNSQFGALCNPKGRVITLYYLLLKDDIFYMIVPSTLCPNITKRLTMFVFRSDVKIKDVSSQFSILGNIHEINTMADKNIFAEINIKEQPRLSFVIKDKVSHTESSNSSISNWSSTLISTGIPRITEATSEAFIPQMLNLDVLNGISFTKGCYTGQEVVARLHYKGTVKRRMYIFSSALLIDSGTDLLIDGNTNSSGTVVECSKQSDSTYTGTVVFKVDDFSTTPIPLCELGDITLKLSPYSLETES
ncbi:MAG: hypothetical protein A6F71_03920 [Cycloclasticus sp. symbiont of Poecilosclerida sp. M]|nr:MAG: hypothetical protein A6F71_03920 [Cycloclasticus sp. symbiont of Poecilosclerida sp. M]